MTAAAVPLADVRQIRHFRQSIPGIGADRNLHPVLRQADAHAVDALRVPKVWRELVVPLVVAVAQIKKDHAVAAVAAFAQHGLDGFVPRQQGRQFGLDIRLLDQIGERKAQEIRNQLARELRIPAALDRQRELHGRSPQGDGFRGAGEQGRVHHVGPMDQLRQPGDVEAETVMRDLGDERRAGAIGGIAEFLAAAIAPKVLRVGGLEKGALVMIEPPSHPRIGVVLEIHDRVVIAAEVHPGEQINRLVHQPAILEHRLGVAAGAIEGAKHRRRGGAVKAFVVVENPHPPQSPHSFFRQRLLDCGPTAALSSARKLCKRRAPRRRSACGAASAARSPAPRN